MSRGMGSEGRLSRFLQPPALRQIAVFCFFEAAFYLAYLYGMSFSQACASPFWFPDAVLLCALLLSRPRNWWVFILGTLPIRLFSPIAQGSPMWFLLATFAIDSAKGLAVATALRVFLKNPIRMGTVKEFGIFCLVAVLLAPAGSAFFGAAALHAIGRDYWTAWEQWFMGDVLVHLVLTPAILYWLFNSRREMRMPRIRKSLEGVFLAVGLILTCWLAFSTRLNTMGILETRYYFPMPLLFWAAIRFGMPGACGGVAIITIFSVDAAIHGRGPFYGESPADTAFSLQQFLLLRAAPLYLVAILIQQKENAEHFLRESEERFRTMADTAPVLIWMSGTDKLCVFFNRGWLEFTGRTLEQELGNGWAESVHPEDLRRCVDIYHTSFNARQPFEMEYRLRRYDGEFRWILDRGIPRYTAGGKFIGYAGMAIDLTDRRLAEEARQDLIHASRLAMLGELTAMIAHELNQPLSAILVNADAMNVLLNLQIAPMDEVRQIVEDIRRDDLRASEAIRRIRALVRKREMELLPLDINATVAEVVWLAKGDASRRGVEIREEYCENPHLIRGDVVHLQQVVLNLILNGMDAMKDNEKAERCLLVRTLRNGEGMMEVSVRDCGHGIPSENLSRVFDSFFTTKQNGMGIGLSMARSIVQLHAGRLWAENNSDGKGTTFRFTVPTLVRRPNQREPSAKSKEYLAEKT